MTEVKFTKGPLEVRYEDEVYADVVSIDRAYGHDDDGQPIPSEANAHLIAAAPELYEALAKIVEYTRNPHVVEIAKPALKKARGESCP